MDGVEIFFSGQEQVAQREQRGDGQESSLTPAGARRRRGRP